MTLSNEVRRLDTRWKTGTGWPKRLDWIEITGLRGWTGQRFDMRFPIMAVVGENGAGKTTVLQCAASVYAWREESKKKDRFASDFFLDTAWDHLKGVEIRYALREGKDPLISSIRKPTGRWRGSPERRRRPVEYIDLSRIQPVSARVGYLKLAKPGSIEAESRDFDQARLDRYSKIMGRPYQQARMAITEEDHTRWVPVIRQQDSQYSGFHAGAGETTIAELLQQDLPRYSLILIDEVESSLHPRLQRRLIRDLADRCRELELQVILTTHSPYILEELPLDARAYILQPQGGDREIVYGVSPDFAMNKMDDVAHYECDIYVEDERAARMLIEILAAHDADLVARCRVIPSGAASVCQALGQMVEKNRFPGTTCVFLDGDNGPAPGCILLPGEDSPERVVFTALHASEWQGLDKRLGRDFADMADNLDKAMTLADHHEWVKYAASRLVVGSDALWSAMCSEWAVSCLDPEIARSLTQAIEDRLAGIEPAPTRDVSPTKTVEPASASGPQADRPNPPSSTAPAQQPGLSLFDVQR